MPHDIDYTPAERRIWEREFADFVPEQVFDAHIHIMRRDSFHGDVPADDFRQKFGGEFRWEQWRAYSRACFPERRVGCNAFGFPDRKTDRDRADAYIGSGADGVENFGMALTDPVESAAVLARRVQCNRLIGYKPYWNMVTGKPASEVTIADMLPDAQLEEAGKHRWIVTLHIPRPGRLADPVNQRDMVAVCRRHPEVTFLFAHIGRAYFRSNVEGFLDGIAACPNAWLDTAMVNHEGVLAYAFRHFPRERMVFGSDAPIAFLRGKSIEVNEQYAYLMAEPYAIGTSVSAIGSPLTFTTFYYEQLRGIRAAARDAGLTPREVENFFAANAVALFRSVYQHNYGVQP